MIKKMMTTPFPTTTYNGPEYFGDRVKETNTLISNIENQQSTTLIAVRRIGKTGLLNHLRNKINKG
jgi:AAA+ ATPase superfamily predicted ATPase